MEIAIIGMGAAGISVLGEWVARKKAGEQIKITVYGEEATFGKGLPYQTNTDVLLLNQIAEQMSICSEKSRDFSDYLTSKGVAHPKGHYATRKQYGEYLTERMQGWLQETKACVYREEVESVRVLEGGRFLLRTASSSKQYDVVHLCAGHTEFNDPYRLEGKRHFIMRPFPVEQSLEEIPENAKVGILGTGLTAVDLLRYQQDHRKDLQLTFFSLDGSFKTIAGPPKDIRYRYFTNQMITEEKEKHQGFIPLTVYKEWLIKEGMEHGIDVTTLWHTPELGKLASLQKELKEREKFAVLQALIGSMDLFLSDLWLALTETDKQRFLNDYYTVWEKFRGAFPLSTGECLVKAWSQGDIQVFSEVNHVEQTNAGFRIGKQGEKLEDVDFLINATGPKLDLSVSTVRSPLLRQLLSERILQPDSFGGIQVVWPEGSAISQKHGVLKNLKVHGSWITGIQFGNNAATLIADGAEKAVRSLSCTNQNKKESCQTVGN